MITAFTLGAMAFFLYVGIVLLLSKNIRGYEKVITVVFVSLIEFYYVALLRG
jgi:hypothetical protein